MSGDGEEPGESSSSRLVHLLNIVVLTSQLANVSISGSAAVKHAEQVYFRSVTNYPSEYTTAEELCFMLVGPPKILWWSAFWSQITLNAAVHVK